MKRAGASDADVVDLCCDDGGGSDDDVVVVAVMSSARQGSGAGRPPRGRRRVEAVAAAAVAAAGGGSDVALVAGAPLSPRQRKFAVMAGGSSGGSGLGARAGPGASGAGFVIDLSLDSDDDMPVLLRARRGGARGPPQPVFVDSDLVDLCSSSGDEAEVEAVAVVPAGAGAAAVSAPATFEGEVRATPCALSPTLPPLHFPHVAGTSLGARSLAP